MRVVMLAYAAGFTLFAVLFLIFGLTLPPKAAPPWPLTLFWGAMGLALWIAFFVTRPPRKYEDHT